MGVSISPEDLVVLALFSVVFAEIYRRYAFWRARRTLLQALADVVAGRRTSRADLVRNVAHVALDAFWGLFIAVDADGRGHVTEYGRRVGRRVLQGIGELVKVRPGTGAVGNVGIDLGALDLDQLAAGVIGSLPKKHQAIAGFVYGFVKPFLAGLGGSGTGAKTETKNPFLQDVAR